MQKGVALINADASKRDRDFSCSHAGPDQVDRRT